MPEERETGPAIALALHQLQAMDLAFGDAVAPLEREPGFDGGQVIPQPSREARQLLSIPLWVASAIQPSERRPRRILDHRQKGLVSACPPALWRHQLAELIEVRLGHRNA